MTDRRTIFTAGIDGAPSEGHRSDDGAVVTLAATLRPGVLQFTGNRTDYAINAAHAIRYTHKQKLSARQWSGALHGLHAAFDYSALVLDPNGGGTFIKRELSEPRQILHAVEQDATPIVTPDEPLVSAHFILHMFKRGDTGIESLWPELAGDDVLNDAAYAECKLLLDQAGVGFPRPFHEWTREEMSGWPEERVWALKNLSALQKQLADILVATREDGTFAFTKRNARQFSSKGKKDFVSAFMYAYVAFLVWLKRNDGEYQENEEDAVGFSAFKR